MRYTLRRRSPRKVATSVPPVKKRKATGSATLPKKAVEVEDTPKKAETEEEGAGVPVPIMQDTDDVGAAVTSDAPTKDKVLEAIIIAEEENGVEYAEKENAEVCEV